MPNDQTRPTQYLIKTGDFFADSCDNMVEILQREQKQDTEQKLTYIRRVTEVYNDDVLLIPRLPAIAVAFSDWDEEVRTIGQKYPQSFMLNIYLNIYYYHSELNDKVRKNEIRNALWELGRIIRRNSDLNGLSSVGATIERGELLHRVRLNKIYSGGRISLKVPVLEQFRRGIS